MDKTFTVFAYGTLMFDDIWQSVVRGSYSKCQATVTGFTRRKIVNELYPCIIAASSHNTVSGIVYFDVTKDDKKRLDDFEGEYYSCQAVECMSTLSKKTIAHAYVLKEQFSYLVSPESWDAAHFARYHKEKFLRGYKGFKLSNT